jgi:hypothetical protein
VPEKINFKPILIGDKMRRKKNVGTKMIRFLLLLLWWGRNDYHFNDICSSALVFCIQQLLLFLLFVAVEFPFRIFGKKS